MTSDQMGRESLRPPSRPPSLTPDKVMISGMTNSARDSCLLSSLSAYPRGVQSWGELDSTCGSLGHSRHRTAAGPKTKQNTTTSSSGSISV